MRMVPNLRPVSLGELLDRTFNLYRNHFLLFVSIAAVAYLPSFAVQALEAAVPGVRVGWATGRLLLTVVFFMAAIAASQAGTVSAVSAVYLERPTSVREAYATVMRLLPRVVLVMIGMGIGILIGTLLFIVPGIILTLMWALTIPVVVLENADLGEALSRSRTLTKGHRLRVLVILVLFTVLGYISLMVFLSPVIVYDVIHAPRPATGIGVMLSSQVLQFLSQCLVTPLMTIALTLLYYDERVRKEAFDIQLLMNSVDGNTKTAAAGIA